MASQTHFVKLAFEVDGQPQLDPEIRLAIEIDGKTFEPKIVKGEFIVPAEVQNGKQIKLRFISGKYDLSFRQMTKQHFDSEWVIGVKNPPFQEDPDGPLVSDGRHLRLIYYIEFRPYSAEGTNWVTRVYD
jgi:hypothetical protein